MSIEERASALCNAATELSELLRIVEQWLNKQPGRVTVAVSGGGPPKSRYMLSFERCGNRWALFIADTESTNKRSREVSQASIDEKVVAAGLIPKLMDEIHVAQTHKTRRVIDARDALFAFIERKGIPAYLEPTQAPAPEARDEN